MDSYRSVMEVMRYVPVPDILLATSTASSLWTRVSKSNELWRSLCEDAGIDLEGGPAESAKERYKEDDHQVLKLCVIRQHSCTTYSIPNLEVQEVPLQQTITIDQFTAYCHISKHSLLCCGGGVSNSIAYSSLAYEVNGLSGQVTELNPMNCSRASHGILQYRKSVYVFGGRNSSGNLNSAEKYSLASQDWKEIRDSMQVRKVAPSLCRYKKKVYVIGGQDIEIFDLMTEAFYLMPLKLAKLWHYNFSFILANDTLVVVQKDEVLQWKLESKDLKFESKPIEKVDNGNYWSNSPLVHYQRCYFGLHNTHGTIKGILKFDIFSNSLQKLIPITYNAVSA